MAGEPKLRDGPFGADPQGAAMGVKEENTERTRKSAACLAPVGFDFAVAVLHLLRIGDVEGAAAYLEERRSGGSSKKKD
jgi:hypothetical protein